MPCNKYKSKKQRGLCYATKEWSDWTGIKSKPKHLKQRIKLNWPYGIGL